MGVSNDNLSLDTEEWIQEIPATTSEIWRVVSQHVCAKGPGRQTAGARVPKPAVNVLFLSFKLIIEADEDEETSPGSV